jgi:tight adherence protein B
MMIAAAMDITMMILPVAGCMLMAFGVYQAVMDSRNQEKSKIVDRLQDRTASPDQSARIKETLLRKPLNSKGAGGFRGQLSRMGFMERIQRLIEQANVEWDPTKMVINTFGIGLLAVVGMFALQQPLYRILVLATVIYVGPFLYLMYLRGRRMRKLLEQLPDVFELLSQALRAGHSLGSGIQLVSERMSDPIGTEFGRVFHEQNLGIKIEEALNNMAARLDQMDIRFFVGAVLIQRQTGGDLAEILDKIGYVVRGRLELFGTIRSLSAEGRMSGIVLLCLPVVVFCALLFLNPDYISLLLEDPDGKIMLWIGIGLQLMGAAMIKWITNIKV